MVDDETDLHWHALEIKNERHMLNQTIPYVVYDDKYPLQRTYNETIFKESPYSKWTETRFFAPAQIQDTVFSEFAQFNWLVSEDNKADLQKDILRAMRLDQDQFEF